MAPAASVAQVVAVAEGPAQGHVIFDESDAGSEIADSMPMLVSKVGETIQAFPVTPTKMPYCDDHSVVSQFHMPYAEDEESSEEESEVWGLLRAAAREAAEEAIKSPEKLPVMPTEITDQEKLPVMPGEINEEENTPRYSDPPQYPKGGDDAMDQNRHYHDHDMVCPYSGHSCPLPAVSPAAPESPMQKKEPMDAGEEQELPHRKLDTMEFRPSDAGFQRFTPKPL